MYRILILIFLSLLANISSSQVNPDAKRDYNWVFGLMYNPPDYGTSIINFNSSPASTYFQQPCLSMSLTNSSISDTNGDLLFYTNGKYVADRNHNRMPHGDSLNFGYFYSSVNDSVSGYNLRQGALILPKPGTLNQYYILHEPQILDPNYFSFVRVDGLYFTKIDMSLNNGLGDVVENQKNIPIFQDTLDVGLISAVRHGNGRDWWIIVAKAFTNCFYRILLTPNGFSNYGLQCIGNINKPGIGQVVFSPNGSSYIRCIDTISTQIPSYINVFSFDRCSGILSEFRTFSTIGASMVRGIAAAPSSKYLYFSNQSHVYQYDITASNIVSTQQLVAVYDTFTAPNLMPVSYNQQLLGPDGKIYIVGGNTQYFSVINQPDSAGVLCDFQAHSFTVPTICDYFMPNYPNFRLGKLVGSVCDTLIVSVTNSPDRSNSIKTYPNPASDFVIFSLDILSNNAPMRLEIFNSLSQKVKEMNLSPYQGIVRLDIRDFAPGVYYAVIKKTKEIVSKCKFSVSD